MLAFVLVAAVIAWGLLHWLEPLPDAEGVVLPPPLPSDQRPMTVPDGPNDRAHPTGELPILGADQPHLLALPPKAETAMSVEGPAAPTVTVRVVDDQGVPVPGVDLMLWSRQPGRHGWSAPQSTRTTSGKGGLAKWTSYPGAAFSVDVWIAPGGYVQGTRPTVSLRQPPSPDGAPPELVLPRRGELTVKMSAVRRLDALERLTLVPPEGKKTYVEDEALLGGDLSWAVDPGTHVLLAYWTERSGLFSPDQRVEVSPGETSVVSLQSLEGEGVLRGRVIDPAGRPVQGVPLEVEIVRQPLAKYAIRGDDFRSVHDTLAGAQGGWQIDGLPPGTAYVTAQVEQFAERYLAARGTVTVERPMGGDVAGGLPRVPPRVDVVVEPAYRVVGRIEGPWREDWLAGRLALSVEPSGTRSDDWSPQHRSFLGPDGSFRIDRCTAGTYEVRITAVYLPVASLVGGAAVPDTSWEGVSAVFDVDPTLPEGAVVQPVLLLEP